MCDDVILKEIAKRLKRMEYMQFLFFTFMAESGKYPSLSKEVAKSTYDELMKTYREGLPK